MHKIALLAAWSLLWAPSLAEAQDVNGNGDKAVELPEDCPLGHAQGSFARKAAGRWFAKGELLVSEEKYDDAVAAFMCSFKLVEHPNTMFNTAQAAMLLGNTELALEMLRRYVQEVPDGPMAQVAAARIADLEQDKKTQEPSSRPHQDDSEPQVSPPLPTHSPQPETPPGPSFRRTWHKPVGIGALGVSGVVAATGVVLHALAGAAQSKGQGTDDYQVFTQSKTQMNSLQTGAIVCYGVAAVAAAAGIAFLFIDKKERPDGSMTIVPQISGTAFLWEF